MGTLEQKPRNYMDVEKEDVINVIEKIMDISATTVLTYDQVLETYKLMEYKRRNDLFVSNGDIFDEQIFGLSEYLKNFIEAFEYAFSSDDSHLECISRKIAEISDNIEAYMENID